MSLSARGFENLLPRPRRVEISKGRFALNVPISLCGESIWFEEKSLIDFCKSVRLQKTATSQRKFIIRRVQNIVGLDTPNLCGFDDERYRIVIREKSIVVEVCSRLGVIRAMQTLQQLIEENHKYLPCCTITDGPAFAVRGFMHDIGRSYLSVDELKREIDLLSLYKVNVFLWHLSDKHGFRFESKCHPAVNTNFTPTRSQSFYTQEQCRAIQDYAYERGMTIIPEIDMPGHSDRFEGATGYKMSSPEGKKILKDILTELSQCFNKSPYVHIGGDETSEATSAYISEMADHLHQLGKMVVVWNRYGAAPAKLADSSLHCDMLTNWATAGTLVKGMPNIDMRYTYINHFDVFADLAGLYRSNILGERTGTPDVAGSIIGLWNDRLISDEKLIIRENNFYANVLACADRAWCGGGQQYIEEGGAYLPTSGSEFEEFQDWERRFLYHKKHALSVVADLIPYMKQTHVRWCVSEAYDNDGDAKRSFAIEQKELLLPDSASLFCIGSGIWLNHIWAGTISGVLGKKVQKRGQTRYAWTYVYSPIRQEVGVNFQTFDYSRSQRGGAPAQGEWDKSSSRVWLNDNELLPLWKWTTSAAPVGMDEEESDLGNLNFTARQPLRVWLRSGWNKVLIKLPFVQTDLPYSQKWQWTFFFTDVAGRSDVKTLIYSPLRQR